MFLCQVPDSLKKSSLKFDFKLPECKAEKDRQLQTSQYPGDKETIRY